MNRAPRLLPVIVKCLVVAFVLLPARLSAGEPSAGPVSRIGVVCPLTGSLAAVGISLKNSMLMADRELDAGQRVEFIFEDDGFDPKRTVSAVNKLLSADHADAIVVFGSGTALAVADMVERKRVPLLAMSMSEQVIGDRLYVYRFFLTAQAQVRRLEEEIRRRGYKTIAVLAAQQEATVRLKNLLLDKISTKVLLNEEIVPAETDLRSVAAKVRIVNPEAVYLVLMPPQLSAMARQLRQAGYSGELFSTMQAQNRPEIEAAAGALEGLWFSSFDDSSADLFYEKYLQTFGESVMPDGALGYDAAKLLIAKPEGQNLPGFFGGLKKFSGIFGDYDLSEPKTFIPASAVKTVTDGRFQMLEPSR